MCLIKDKDGILLEFEGATIAAVKRDICTRHPYTPDHISLYKLTEHGMCVDAMEDDAAVESLDVFYMQVTPTLTRAEQEAFASTPTSLPDVTRTLQAYNEQLLEPVEGADDGALKPFARLDDLGKLGAVAPHDDDVDELVGEALDKLLDVDRQAAPLNRRRDEPRAQSDRGA